MQKYTKFANFMYFCRKKNQNSSKKHIYDKNWFRNYLDW